MRILKFAGTFFGTLLLIFLIVFGFNLDALTTLFNNSKDLQEGQQWVSKATSLKGLTEYIGENPNHAAVVSRSGINPDTTISYQGEKARTMGTLSNLFLITTYARLIEKGNISPKELISLNSTDRYQLPYIDASNHENAKAALSNEGIINSENQVPLDQIVQKAIIYNDLAFSDYLFHKLGKAEIDSTISILGLSNTDMPLPFSGLYIALHPKMHDTTFSARFKKLQNWSKDRFQDSVLSATKHFRDNNQFHKKVISVFEEQQGLGTGFTERRDALNMFPKSTADELSQLMVQLEQDSLLSPAISRRVKNIMDWPYERQSLNNDFKHYGAIYDNRLGLLNGIDYGASVYSKEPFGQAVFFDSLQVAFWFHMSSNLMHQDYQQRLMWDPALRKATQKEISTQ
ncbi:Beta-lactamase enzyme family protein [Fodinibius salinus]|uniref:Beta-lactamase enzyme family protein n=1 Tax=Fodinibius salinus TaxID=860790 RepID=A0A5D3YJ18_9BACT|nr:serine hydrolase [Fodinibius salinus]TYP92725.1 Beta-lactamase enzyme family protein [Fodinibius salinus]